VATLELQRIVKTFGCRLRNNYGASEFFSIAWECAHGVMHLNDDWMIAEPVDRDDRPVPQGEASHALLLTNLANRTQPLLRYRLSDSLRVLRLLLQELPLKTAVRLAAEVTGASRNSLYDTALEWKRSAPEAGNA